MINLPGGNHRAIGRCSHCGGDVVVPLVWHGINPPVPTCTRCGATKRNDLPVIDMDPPPRDDRAGHRRVGRDG